MGCVVCGKKQDSFGPEFQHVHPEHCNFGDFWEALQEQANPGSHLAACLPTSAKLGRFSRFGASASHSRSIFSSIRVPTPLSARMLLLGWWWGPFRNPFLRLGCLGCLGPGWGPTRSTCSTAARPTLDRSTRSTARPLDLLDHCSTLLLLHSGFCTYSSDGLLPSISGKHSRYHVC